MIKLENNPFKMNDYNVTKWKRMHFSSLEKVWLNHSRYCQDIWQHRQLILVKSRVVLSKYLPHYYCTGGPCYSHSFSFVVLLIGGLSKYIKPQYPLFFLHWIGQETQINVFLIRQCSLVIRGCTQILAVVWLNVSTEKSIGYLHFSFPIKRARVCIVYLYLRHCFALQFLLKPSSLFAIMRHWCILRIFLSSNQGCQIRKITWLNLTKSVFQIVTK